MPPFLRFRDRKASRGNTHETARNISMPEKESEQMVNKHDLRRVTSLPDLSAALSCEKPAFKLPASQIPKVLASVKFLRISRKYDRPLDSFKTRKPEGDFYSFKELPKDIRIRIWMMSLPESHEIQLRVQYKNHDYNEAEFGYPASIIHSVCEESRRIVCAKYWIFSQKMAFPPAYAAPLCRHPTPYFVDTSVDTFKINFSSLFNPDFIHFIKCLFMSAEDLVEQVRSKYLQLAILTYPDFLVGLDIVHCYQDGLAHIPENDNKVEKFLYDTVAGFWRLEDMNFILADTEGDVNPVVARAFKKKVLQAFARQQGEYPWAMIQIPMVSWDCKKMFELKKILDIRRAT